MQYNKTIVISAVNLVNGGTFTILKDFLSQLILNESVKSYKIIALVHGSENLPVSDNVNYKIYKLPKKNYLFRIFYEYIFFFFLSLKLKPEIWISLHDMTPNVIARKRFVYMHNPAPFFEDDRKTKLSLKFKLFVKFYGYLYKCNVKKNTAVIVQQDWFRKAISSLYKIDAKKIIVSYPEFETARVSGSFEKGRFFFPSYPREFKNFDVVCEAAEILVKEKISEKCALYLTIDGTENSYAKNLCDRFQSNPLLHFIGLQDKQGMQENYDKCECLIFPSKLETWGLPISEFKNSGKKIILADLPYAKETANSAKSVAFFSPSDARSLADLIKSVCSDDFSEFHAMLPQEIDEPFCKNWQQLIYSIIRISRVRGEQRKC